MIVFVCARTVHVIPLSFAKLTRQNYKENESIKWAKEPNEMNYSNMKMRILSISIDFISHSNFHKGKLKNPKTHLNIFWFQRMVCFSCWYLNSCILWFLRIGKCLFYTRIMQCILILIHQNTYTNTQKGNELPNISHIIAFTSNDYRFYLVFSRFFSRAHYSLFPIKWH